MTSDFIELELPLAISENVYRRYVPGCNHPVICAAGRKYHELVKHRFADSGQRGIPGPVRIALEFYPPDARKRDLDNQFKCLFDSIVKAGCIDDDSQIFELYACKREPIPEAHGLNYLRIGRYNIAETGSITALIKAGDLMGAINKYGIEKVAFFLQSRIY